MHNRQSIRLKGYDYTQPGAYLITLATQGRDPVFGQVVGGKMRLNPVGKMVEREWLRLGSRFPRVEPDEFGVMPDHFHGVLFILETASGLAQPLSPSTSPVNVPPSSLGAIVRAFKSSVAVRYKRMCGQDGTTLWQRNYYERIIRNAEELDNMRLYIRANPAAWEKDAEKPSP
jgi:REP element-mobilizing transposase RayT